MLSAASAQWMREREDEWIREREDEWMREREDEWMREREDERIIPLRTLSPPVPNVLYSGGAT